MANKECIWIGPDQFIEYLDFDPRGQAVFEIDDLLRYGEKYVAQNLIDQLLDKLETECVVGCCGIGALRFWPEDINRALEHLDRVRLLEELIELKTRLISSNDPIVVYHRLNQYFMKSTFLELLDHLLSEVEKQESDGVLNT